MTWVVNCSSPYYSQSTTVHVFLRYKWQKYDKGMTEYYKNTMCKWNENCIFYSFLEYKGKIKNDVIS